MPRRSFSALLLLGLLTLVGCGRATINAGSPPSPSSTPGAPSSPTITATPIQPPFPALSLYTGEDDGSILALNSTDGTLRWRFQTGGSSANVAAIANEIVYADAYVSSNGSSMLTIFYALNARDSSVRWKYQTDGQGRILMVGNGVVYATAVGIPNTPAQPPMPWLPNHVYALSADDGKLLWNAQITGSGNMEALLDQGVIYVASTDPFGATPQASYLYALNASDGSVRWRRQAQLPLAQLDAIANRSLFVTESYPDGPAPLVLIALSASDGSDQWQRTADFIGLDHDLVYASSNTGVVALNVGDGSLRWQIAPDGLSFPAPATVANGLLYLAGNSGAVFAYSGKDGSVLWQSQVGMGASFPGNVQVINSVVYIPIQNQGLYALTAQDGKALWHVQMGYTVDISSLVSGVLYGVMSQQNATARVIALKSDDGSLRWQYDLGTSELFTLIAG